MKPLGFLISLLAHALFLLLLVTARFPVPDSVVSPRIIQIVPMSPPPPAARMAPAPRLVYVRPFVLKGGAPGASRGISSGKESLHPAGSAAASRPAGAAGAPEPVAPKGEGPPPAAGNKRLTIDMGRIEKKLKQRGSSGTTGGGPGPSAPAQQALPFGDGLPQDGAASEPGGGAGGDGTGSTALAGNAFFDSRGYDITPWAKRMVYRVKKNWIFPPATAYGLRGTVGIYVLIQRDGSVGRVYIRKASGIRPFDQAAFNAIGLSAPLPPLPDDFPYDDLPAYLLFHYN